MSERDPVVESEAANVVRHVASLLAPTAASPGPARRVGLLTGLLLYWLMPRRYGPHLAVASLKRALLAHATLVLAVLLCVVWACSSELHFRVPNWSEWREWAAAAVLHMASQSAYSRWNWIPILLVLGSLPLGELGLVLLGVLAMPWAAGGDSTRSVFSRSLRNVYWSTVVLIPGAVIWTAGYLVLEKHQLHGDAEFAAVVGMGALLVAVVVLWLRCVVVGAAQYVGSAEGPAFGPREPHCEGCGYLIIGLPLESNCPECGLRVRDSLPGGRRQPTRWQGTEMTPDGFGDLLRLQWRIPRDAAFFLRLPVQQGFRAARHFWWGTYLLILAATLVVLKFTQLLPLQRPADLALASVLTATLPLLAQSLVMFAGCLWAQMRYGIRDYRVSAVVCYYTSPFLWGLAILIPLGVVLSALDAYQLLEVRLSVGTVDGESVAVMLWGLLFLLLAGLWWRRLCRGLEDVRFANS